MAEKKVSTQKKADNAKAAKESEEKREEKQADTDAALAEERGAEDTSAEGEGKVETAHDVLLDTGGPEGTTLEEAKAEAEEDGEADANVPDPKEASDSESEAAKEAEPKDPAELDSVADDNAAPFSGTAVAGATEKTFGQKAQLYTDGLSGNADHDLGRAY
jgi:hypothetical protein